VAFASELTRPGRFYVRAVSLLGLFAAGESVFQIVRSPLQPQWILLAVLTLISGSASVKLPWAHVSISISEAFVFTAVLLYGPPAGTLTVVLDCLVISYWIAKRRPEFDRALFNIAAPSLSIWCSGHLFFYLSGVAPLAEEALPLNPAAVLNAILPSLILFAVTYFLLNSWLVTFVIAIEKHESAWHIWRDNFVWLSLNYLFGASVAVFLVGYNRTIDLRFVAVIVPLLLVLYSAFRTSTQRVEDANKHVDQLNSLYLSTIETLAMAIDAKDQVTHGHIRRVQSQATRLAGAIGVRDTKLVKAIEAAALLHDMGKLAIPEHILNKPGKLTHTEFEKMKLHASVGADILSAIDFPYPVVPIVRHHHENWDGSGYPARLKGTEIPIGARILSVVDCFDALTSDRPYRPKLSDSEAAQILLERRGTMYDPMIVDTFITMNTTLPDSAPTKGLESEVLKTIASSGARTQTHPLPVLKSATMSEGPIVSEIARHLCRAGEVSESDSIMANVNALIPCCLCIFYEYDIASDELVSFKAIGEGASAFLDVRIPLGKRLSGWVAANRQAIFNSDPLLDLSDAENALTKRLLSCLSVPLVSENGLLGVLTFYSSVRNGFDVDHQRIAEVLSAEIAKQFKGLGQPPALADRVAG
jgi:putative nucleotidyltransferase with HDIG domain